MTMKRFCQVALVVKALSAGVIVSLAIEGSQLVWKKGVFDVDDLFNNAVGAVLGGLIVVAVIDYARRLYVK